MGYWQRLVLFVLAFLMGAAIERTRSGTAAIQLTETRQKLLQCDTEVLRAQKELNDAVEAFWASREPCP